jgi:ferric-dicitrate binding protein FerR (iron transport regulator)
VSRAREILRDYLERRRSGPGTGSPEAFRDENLRRLLRHVSAARQPTERLEPRLLEAMRREGRETAGRRGRGWRRFSRPAWLILAPATALAGIAAAVIWHAHSIPVSRVAYHPLTPPGISHRVVSPTPESRERTVVGLVIMGELERRQPGENRWAPVDSGSSIFLGDRVRTGPAATGSIVFLDGSVSRLLPNSTLQYTAAAHGGIRRPNRVLLARGEAWHTIEKGGPPFVVQTPTAEAIVHGTEFGVSVDARRRTTLRVKTGLVELRAARAMVMVVDGMQSVVLPGHGPTPPMRVRPLVRTATDPKGHSGPLHTVPPASHPKAEPEKAHGAIFHRSPPPGAPTPGPSEPASPPGDTSGAGTAKSDDGAEAAQPFSTSR